MLNFTKIYSVVDFTIKYCHMIFFNFTRTGYRSSKKLKKIIWPQKKLEKFSPSGENPKEGGARKNAFFLLSQQKISAFFLLCQQKKKHLFFADSAKKNAFFRAPPSFGFSPEGENFSGFFRRHIMFFSFYYPKNFPDPPRELSSPVCRCAPAAHRRSLLPVLFDTTREPPIAEVYFKCSLMLCGKRAWLKSTSSVV